MSDCQTITPTEGGRAKMEPTNTEFILGIIFIILVLCCFIGCLYVAGRSFLGGTKSRIADEIDYSKNKNERRHIY